MDTEMFLKNEFTGQDESPEREFFPIVKVEIDVEDECSAEPGLKEISLIPIKSEPVTTDLDSNAADCDTITSDGYPCNMMFGITPADEVLRHDHGWIPEEDDCTGATISTNGKGMEHDIDPSSNETAPFPLIPPKAFEKPLPDGQEDTIHLCFDQSMQPASQSKHLVSPSHIAQSRQLCAGQCENRQLTQGKPTCCQFCKERFTMADSLKVRTNKRYQCQVCEKRFTHPCDLKLHETVHTGEKAHQCQFCEKKFARKSYLKNHEKQHLGEKAVCQICNKSFSRPDSLRRHEATHSSEKPFQCQFCDKRFSLASNLRLHEMTHTREMPFQCRFCEKKFQTATVLKYHERTHTGEKPYQCQVCDRRFNTTHNLKCHERTHTGEKPFECQYCNKAFARRSDAKLHEKIHTNDRPYQCQVCEKRFTQAYRLKCHERTHTDEKPSKCEEFERDETAQDDSFEETVFPVPSL